MTRHAHGPRRHLAALIALGFAAGELAGLPAASAQQGSQPDLAPGPSQRSTPGRPQDPGAKGSDKSLPPKGGKRAENAPPKPIPKSMRPPGGNSIPQGAGERAKLLDELYAHLATAEDETVAGRVAAAIEQIWATTGSDTVSLLMARARRASEEKKPELAIRLLDQAIELAPDYPELFNARAAMHFGQNNLTSSVADLRRVLALEPNHYKAMETLGQIFKDIGQKKAALAMYRKLAEVYPLMPGTKTTLDELEREVNGQAS